jgi:hypothetical protein
VEPKGSADFITGHGSTDAIERKQRDYLVKPLDILQLQQIVDQRSRSTA